MKLVLTIATLAFMVANCGGKKKIISKQKNSGDLVVHGEVNDGNFALSLSEELVEEIAKAPGVPMDQPYPYGLWGSIAIYNDRVEVAMPSECEPGGGDDAGHDGHGDDGGAGPGDDAGRGDDGADAGNDDAGGDGSTDTGGSATAGDGPNDRPRNDDGAGGGSGESGFALSSGVGPIVKKEFRLPAPRLGFDLSEGPKTAVIFIYSSDNKRLFFAVAHFHIEGGRVTRLAIELQQWPHCKEEDQRGRVEIDVKLPPKPPVDERVEICELAEKYRSNFPPQECNDPAPIIECSWSHPIKDVVHSWRARCSRHAAIAGLLGDICKNHSGMMVASDRFVSGIMCSSQDVAPPDPNPEPRPDPKPMPIEDPRDAN